KGRNLTKYDALTFWAKGSVTAEIGLFGFGTDFEGDKHAVGLNNVTLSTDWRKYTIPIPDASKLVQEKGVFAFSAGTANTSGLGYTLWMDEIRFERLGIVAQPLTSIFGGENNTQTSYTDSVIKITGITQTVTLGDGSVVKIAIAPGYLDFKTSNPFVAQVNELGEITVVGAGTATITASLNGVDAVGSTTINSVGIFDLPDAPTHAAADVISIFSDAYENVPVDFYNGYWEPYQTTTSADFDVNGDNILSYENFNFVGHQFGSPTVNGSQMTHFHFDVFIPGSLPSDAKLKVTIKDFGADGADGNGDDTTQVFTLTSADLTGDAWSSIDIPLSLSPKSKIGQLIYENDGSNVTALYLDNVYFYKK
ncbi:MAG: glycosyl hydrolase family 16, partial [Bacteroidetes bacterium]|nr:glycosyl hydrolase family 16 [Bacteroidota bacterium]